jgi:hypothetical protein
MMKQLTIDDLRALIRLIPAAQALRDELDKSMHLETFEGTAALAARSFVGLQHSVMSITEDPYVGALGIEFDERTPEKLVIAQVILAASQLVAYMEGQAGISGLTGKRDYSVQTAPSITLNMDGFQGGPFETERIMETIDRVMQFHPPPPLVPPMPPPPPGAPPSPDFPFGGQPIPPIPPSPPVPPSPDFPFGNPPGHWHEDDSV